MPVAVKLNVGAKLWGGEVGWDWKPVLCIHVLEVRLSFMPELPDGDSRGVPPEKCSVRGASPLVRSPLPCCCSWAMPCTWAVLPTLVGRLPMNGGHHQAVCRLGPTPFLSSGARGGSPVHGVPRCPQVTGLQVTKATSLLPGYGNPSAGGEPTGLVSPQGPPMGDPTAPLPKL